MLRHHQGPRQDIIISGGENIPSADHLNFSSTMFRGSGIVKRAWASEG